MVRLSTTKHLLCVPLVLMLLGTFMPSAEPFLRVTNAVAAASAAVAVATHVVEVAEDGSLTTLSTAETTTSTTTSTLVEQPQQPEELLVQESPTIMQDIINNNVHDDDSDDTQSQQQPQSQRQVAVTSSMELPFSADIAFMAFSDLRRQADFSPMVQSVEFLNPPPAGVDVRGRNMGETKWTMGLHGIRFSFRAISTRLERPHVIEWESTSGMKNFGRVHFRTLGENRTHMTMTMTFVMPRLLASICKRSGHLASYVQKHVLQPTLSNFRDQILAVDLGGQQQQQQQQQQPENVTTAGMLL